MATPDWHWTKKYKHVNHIGKMSEGWKNLIPNHKTGENRICPICKKEYYAQVCFIKKGYRKFCGKVCYGVSRRGQDRFSSLYKGDKVGYTGLHNWVKRKLGKPQFCEGCGIEEAYQFEWANISGEYKRDLEDWIRLCTPCHRRMDDNVNKAWNTRRAKSGIV